MEEYEGIIKMSKTSMKAKQLASQLIPRYFNFFPTLSTHAFHAHVDCIEDGDLGVCLFFFFFYIQLIDKLRLGDSGSMLT